jgi:hypothetical protein
MRPFGVEQKPGRVVIKPNALGFYWHAFVGDERINGGLCDDYTEAQVEAKRAIAIWRKRDWMDNYYFDAETQKWYRKGTLPPV